jgi:4'-phosphopantetheinyl transferase EntD
LSSLCGPEIVVESATPMLVNEQLFPEERQYIERAVETRRAQFGTARVSARRGLARFGIASCALVPNLDRSPRWPSGITGSIAHTERHCAVVLTDAHSFAAIGLDFESDAPLRAGVEDVVCTESEQAWLNGLDRSAMMWLGALVFSAKEAFYKCQYSVTQTMLDFKDVELTFDLEAGRFAVANLRAGLPLRSRLLRIEGRACRAPDLVVTMATLSA